MSFMPQKGSQLHILQLFGVPANLLQLPEGTGASGWVYIGDISDVGDLSDVSDVNTYFVHVLIYNGNAIHLFFLC